MYLRPDPAWKFGCGRYIQRPDAFMDLKKEIGRIGSKALILSGRKVWQAVLDVYDAPLEGIDCCHRIHTQHGTRFDTGINFVLNLDFEALRFQCLLGLCNRFAVNIRYSNFRFGGTEEIENPSCNQHEQQ